MNITSLLLYWIKSIVDGESKEDLALHLSLVAMAEVYIKPVLLACWQASLVEDCLSVKSIYKFF